MTKYLFIFDFNIDGSQYEVIWDPDKESTIFEVKDLCDIPEDAVVYRSLFNAYDAKGLIEEGMKFQRLGYESVSYIHKIVPENVGNLHTFMYMYAKNYLQHISK